MKIRNTKDARQALTAIRQRLVDIREEIESLEEYLDWLGNPGVDEVVGVWVCPKCKAKTWAGVATCENCGEPQPA